MFYEFASPVTGLAKRISLAKRNNQRSNIFMVISGDGELLTISVAGEMLNVRTMP